MNGTDDLPAAATFYDAVRAFHAAALRHGGTDEGAPGPRDYHPDYFGAYVRDLDGNKLNVSVGLEREARASASRPPAPGGLYHR